jgi:crossover junction endodeoxyribonuclease RuvC
MIGLSPDRVALSPGRLAGKDIYNMIICIDPGMSGSVAWTTKDGITEYYNAPYSASELCDVLRGLKVIENCVCYVEAVHSFPGQGVSSTFKFGEGFGIIQGLLTALAIPYQMITPQGWMKQIPNLPKDKKKRKTALKEYSQRLYPNLKVTLKNADALAMLSTRKEI